MKKSLCMLLLLVCLLNAKGQTPHLFFDHLDIKKGLPEGNVRSIKEDKQGYMWFSTQNGLVRYDGYRYKIYSLGDSKTNIISTTNIQGLLLSKDGDLWASTIANGLFKYNRFTDSFQGFPYPDKSTIVQLSINAFDHDNNVWGSYYTSNQSYMVRFNIHTGKYEFYESHGKGKINSLSKPVSAPSGDVLFGSDNGLYRFDWRRNKIIAYFSSADTAKTRGANPAYEAPSQPGIIWINTFHGQNIDLRVSRLDVKTGQLTEYKQGKAAGDLADAAVNNIYEDKHKQLWFATLTGLSALDRLTNKFINYAPAKQGADKPSFDALRETTDGSFWLTTNSGPAFFNIQTKEFQFYTHNEDEPGSFSNSLIAYKLIDHTGTLWASTFNAGIDRLNQQKSAFQLSKHDAKKADSYPGGAADLQRAADGNVIVTAGNGVYQWTVGTNHYQKLYAAAPADHINTAYKTRDGLLYMANSGGLLVYHPQTGQKEQYSPRDNDSTSILTKQIDLIYEDHTGTIWLSTSNQKGLCSFNPQTKKFTRYPYRQSLEPITPQNKYFLDDAHVLSIYEDRQNNLWIGTNFGGMNLFHPQTKTFTSSLSFQNAHDDLSKSFYCISSIFQDSKGRFWAGTYLSGIFIFDPKTNTCTRRFDESSGLIYNSVGGISEDKSGYIWVITERGLTRIDPVSFKLKNFRLDELMPGVNVSRSLRCMTSLSDGRIIISLSNGLATFDPKNLSDNLYPPIVHIEDFVYSNPRQAQATTTRVMAYKKKQIELPYSQNRIQFNYIALHYDNPQENTYAYRLDGYDKQWIQAGTTRTVTYTNLPPGTYTFRVIAANSSGVWNKTGASIIVTIRWPWWFTWWSWLIYIGLFVLAVYSFIKYRSKKLISENQLLEEKVTQRTHQLNEQQEEITAQRDQLAETVDRLQATQTQLIQAEKMASLGELTAGIAHEIQNPLNFVNNFSDVSIELLDDMDAELSKGDTDEAKAIALDIKQNLEKIAHHGRRADSIVKGMLQHSRATSGHKEPVNINNLVDEHLRLAYHGLRAKDKSFNAELITSYGENMPPISVTPQDIGRVLLNLFNNAFYATQQKQREAGNHTYQPKLEVSTIEKDNQIMITVTDNGTGIPDAIKAKILQPFFTTKPTGQGTGLGLSLSYDIIKAHNGILEITSEESKGATFKITLPIIT